MILEKQTENLVMEDGDIQQSTDMMLDLDSATFLMQMLSKFYSDGIGSLIRETASNALDSHRSVGTKDPIIVSLTQAKDGNYEFSVEDFGMGIGADTVENVIKKYGKSTKRQSKDQLGAFGLGFKSPLAYTSSFYFIGRKDGIERKYMMYESQDEANKIDLLYESPTKEKNGVKIIVPVKYGDKYDFIKKINEQLCYFENVYFNVDGINNDFKIVRHELFQWSEICDDDKLHICLDNVYYPLDFTKLGISNVHFPVGLRFSLTDGIFPVPNREQLKYTKEAKEIILKRLREVADYFINKYNEQIKETEDVFSALNYYSSSYRNVPSFDGKSYFKTLALKTFSSISYITPKLKGVELLDLSRIYTIKEYLIKEYQVQSILHRGRFSQGNSSWRASFNYDKLQQDHLYTYSDKIEHQKKQWLRSQVNGGETAFFFKKTKDFTLGKVKANKTDYTTYMDLLELRKAPKKEWRARISECRHIISLLTKGFIDLDKTDIPAAYIAAQKASKAAKKIKNGGTIRRKKLVGEVTGKMSAPLERYVSGSKCKFVPTVIQLKEAHKAKYIIVYGGKEHEDKFQKYFTVFNNKDVKFVIFSDRELKNLKEVELHNWIKMEDFEQGKHKVFKRMVTAYLISKLKGEYSHVFSNSSIFTDISVSFRDKILYLDKYSKDFYLRGDEELYKSLISVAEENNLFDEVPYSAYKEMKFLLKKLRFLQPLLSSLNTGSGYYSTPIKPEVIEVIKDLFKYYKQRMDWQNYNLPINKEEIEELTEELVEQTI